MVLANAGLGAVHGLVAPLGGRCAIPHGIGCACLLVETLRVNLDALRSRDPQSPALVRYQEAATALGSESPDKLLEGLSIVRRLLDVQPLTHYGMTEADIDPIVAASRGGSMKTNPIELRDEELREILRASMSR
jgi:alcohol dehydrogenase